MQLFVRKLFVSAPLTKQSCNAVLPNEWLMKFICSDELYFALPNFVLPDTTEESDDEEGDFFLRQARDESAKSVDKHGDHQHALSPVDVGQSSPQVAADEHADEEDGRQPALFCRRQP